MDRTRVPGIVGVAAAIAGVLAIGAPGIETVSPEVSGLGTYYASGALGGVFASVLAGLLLVVAVALVGVARGEADPALASGVAVGLGIVATLVTLEWALAVDTGLVASLGRATWLAWHRWALLAIVAIVPVAAFTQRRFRGD